MFCIKLGRRLRPNATKEILRVQMHGRMQIYAESGSIARPFGDEGDRRSRNLVNMHVDDVLNSNHLIIRGT
jgi:hypothetical protein